MLVVGRSHAVAEIESCSKDAIGNREKAADSLAQPSTPNYMANALNQYSTANNIALPSTPYDLDGNYLNGPLPVETGNATLVWDAENRLKSVTSASGAVIAYSYDYLGRRISKQIGSCLLYTSPSPRDQRGSRMPSSA